jgi:hypothetical protein
MALKAINSSPSPVRNSGPSTAAIRKAIEDNDGQALASVADIRRPSLTLAVIDTDDTDVVVREVSNLWSHAQQTFLAIGRYLAQTRRSIQLRVDGESVGLTEAERRLRAQAEFKRLVLLRLPFSNKVASQLECVARAVFMEERLSPEELPLNYSIAYQLTTLTDHELDCARAEGIVCPDVRRGTVIIWKRRMRETLVNRHRELEARREQLLTSLKRMQRDLADVERELATLKHAQATVIEGAVEGAEDHA